MTTSLPRIDQDKLDLIKKKFLFDMNICKRTFCIIENKHDICWHCGEQCNITTLKNGQLLYDEDYIHGIPLDTGLFGRFCCCHCIYSFVSMNNLFYSINIKHIINKLKNIYQTDVFTIMPPKCFLDNIDIDMKTELFEIKKNIEHIYSISMTFLNNTIKLTIDRL